MTIRAVVWLSWLSWLSGCFHSPRRTSFDRDFQAIIILSVIVGNRVIGLCICGFLRFLSSLRCGLSRLPAPPPIYPHLPPPSHPSAPSSSSSRVSKLSKSFLAPSQHQIPSRPLVRSSWPAFPVYAGDPSRLSATNRASKADGRSISTARHVALHGGTAPQRP